MTSFYVRPFAALNSNITAAFSRPKSRLPNLQTLKSLLYYRYGHRDRLAQRWCWKSTTAVHIAAYLQKKARTVLVDSDPNRSVCGWAVNGTLPFEVIPLHQAARRTREFEHVVIDTNAGLRPDELREVVEGCDLLVIPTTPDALSYQSLNLTIGQLENIKGGRYKGLLPSFRRGQVAMAMKCARNSKLA